MIARYALAIAIGTVVTFALLFMMQALIAMGDRTLKDSERRFFVDFVRVERQQLVERKDRKPEKPPEPQAPPPSAPTPRSDSLNPTGESISIAAPELNVDVSIGGTGIGVSDGDYLPIVKVAPIYPRRALSRGIEGYVIVEFVVTKTGTVRDPVVVEAEPSNIFNDAAIQAALKFKYKPRVVDGNAIEVAGVRNKITFQLED